jgi:ABC-type multidrug transport system fused ATPase/permease subunit
MAAIIKPVLSVVQTGGGIEPSAAWLIPSLKLGGLIVAMFALLGGADFFERLYFARFVIRTVRSLRTDIMSRVLGEDVNSIRRGDMVARLVGDTARLKAGLNGFLVHVSVNVILFLGITAVLFWVNRELGLLLSAGGIVIFLITVKGAAAVYRRSIKNRSKEGELGNLITAAGPGDAQMLEKLNRSSGKQEAVVTKLQGYTTWAVYIVFGIIVAAGLALAMKAVAEHRLDGSVVVVFALYAMQLRTPLVQLARQGANTGKIVACSERLEELSLQPASAEERFT